MLERTRTRTSWLDDVTGFGKVTVEPLEWLPLEFLCFNVRAIDKHEIANMLPTDNPLEWAATIHHAIAKNGCGWVARFNGRPAACMGVFENHPGCWQIYSFGTDDYPRVLAFFKPKLDRMIGFARERGMHRLECRSTDDHYIAHGCIKLLGLTKEATLRAFGRNKQDYILFSRVWL